MQFVDVDEAVSRLKRGGLVIYPTETFFGIGCLTTDDQALAKVFQVKKRLLAMPLPVIVADFEQLLQLSKLSVQLEADVQRLQAQFWPGPLSLVLPAKSHLSPLLTGGTGKVALRISPHPVAFALSRLTGQGLVASSANISGRPPVTSALELDRDLADQVDAIVAESPSPSGGLASTIVEPLGNGLLRMLRPGAVSGLELEQNGFVLSGGDHEPNGK